MEIYLDRGRDLLDNNHGTTQEKKLEVRQDQAKGNFVPGLTSKEVKAFYHELAAALLTFIAFGSSALTMHCFAFFAADSVSFGNGCARCCSS